MRLQIRSGASHLSMHLARRRANSLDGCAAGDLCAEQITPIRSLKLLNYLER
jgi:hypothetical protein